MPGVTAMRGMLYSHCAVALFTVFWVYCDSGHCGPVEPLCALLFGYPMNIVTGMICAAFCMTPIAMLATAVGFRVPARHSLPMILCDFLLAVAHFRWFLFLC
jgi:hypothetical protein